MGIYAFLGVRMFGLTRIPRREGRGMCLPEDGRKGVKEASVGKVVSRSGEFSGVRAGAREENLVGHFA